jgi:xanthine dehydrogenase YagS FAD-binding subunit
MHPFDYIVPATSENAIARHVALPQSAFLAGGTNLIDDMKLGVDNPTTLIDISRLPLNKIEPLANGGLRIGATVRNSELAYDETVRKKYPALAQAILSGASPQLRNAATTAGNLLQRTRCYYFRDVSQPCNKRQPGAGCAAIQGFNRIHAILGTSDKCIATHPSDMDVALVAFDAVIQTQGPNGARAIAINDFYVSYGQDPARENVLGPGELIVAVDLPPTPWFTRSTYLKVRDRASYEFALASAAVAMDLSGGVIRDVRLALGGVATKPWRAFAAEKVLRGQTPGPDIFAAAADAELKNAVPQRQNAFKIKLCKATIVTALETVSTMS